MVLEYKYELMTFLIFTYKIIVKNTGSVTTETGFVSRVKLLFMVNFCTPQGRLGLKTIVVAIWFADELDYLADLEDSRQIFKNAVSIGFPLYSLRTKKIRTLFPFPCHPE